MLNIENENLNVTELNEEELEEVAGGKSSSGQYVKATAEVHVRAKNDKESKSLGVLSSGDKVKFKGESRNDSRGVAWYKVSYKGDTGWVSSKYSKIVTK